LTIKRPSNEEHELRIDGHTGRAYEGSKMIFKLTIYTEPIPKANPILTIYLERSKVSL
jgi:hypothetical protein